MNTVHGSNHRTILLPLATIVTRLKVLPENGLPKVSTAGTTVMPLHREISMYRYRQTNATGKLRKKTAVTAIAWLFQILLSMKQKTQRLNVLRAIEA